MAIVGFNFNKINVEKKSFSRQKVNISNNVAIVNVEKAELSLGASKQKGLKFEFNFKSKYEPEVGIIELEGDIIYLGDSKEVEEVLKSWKKDKKVPEAVMSQVLNTVLTKCNVEALILSREVTLPPPIPMPRVNINPQTKKK